MKKQLTVAMTAMLVFSALSLHAQTTTTTAAKTRTKRHVKARAAEETQEQRSIRELQEKMAAQQSQIDALTQQNEAKDAALAAAQSSAATAQSQAAEAATRAQGVSSSVETNANAINSMKSDVDSLKSSNASLATSVDSTQKQVSGVEKFQSKLSDLANGKLKIGATFFGDYAYYAHTGFGPQFLTQMNQDGPGNDGFNSFDVTRTYINFLYTPTPAVTLRIVPNIYRQIDTSTAMGNGSGSGIASSSNGNLGFRLKYAYLQFNTIFKGSDAFKKDTIRFGQTMNPLIDWEEGLYGYRYVNLVPWNYLSLSSTYTGAQINGPIEFNGKEYLDYQIGVFNTASFHAVETNDKKQAMARITWYPFGTKTDRTGLGITGFEDYGYNTKTPDATSTVVNRIALLAHYQSPSKAYLIAFEYDLGHNAFSTGNMFSGAGPADLVGLGPTKYATLASLSTALLAGTHTRQQGFDVFGHAQLGHTPFSVVGTYQNFQPNTRISVDDPLDFQRIVGGIGYKVNANLDITIDSQNVKYSHSQYNLTGAQLATFSTSLATADPGGISNVVPTDTNAVFLNMQYSF